MGFWDGSGISWTVSKQYAPRSSGAARGEASPYGWTSRNYVMCAFIVMELLRITRQIHCTAAEQRATLIHRQYNRDWGTSYSRPPIYLYHTSPLLQNPGGATASLQMDNHTTGCSSWRPTNSVKALKAEALFNQKETTNYPLSNFYIVWNGYAINWQHKNNMKSQFYNLRWPFKKHRLWHYN